MQSDTHTDTQTERHTHTHQQTNKTHTHTQLKCRDVIQPLSGIMTFSLSLSARSLPWQFHFLPNEHFSLANFTSVKNNDDRKRFWGGNLSETLSKCALSLLTCSSAILEVFWSLMMVLLNAFCISSICLRYLQNKADRKLRSLPHSLPQ